MHLPHSSSVKITERVQTTTILNKTKITHLATNHYFLIDVVYINQKEKKPGVKPNVLLCLFLPSAFEQFFFV